MRAVQAAAVTAATYFPRPLPSPGTHPVDPATRRLRRLRLAGTLAGHSVRTVLGPRTPTRRQRLRVCSAADVLTALGVRVRVVGPAAPWPRSGRLVVSDHTGRLGDLALATVVRGTPVLGVDVLDAPPGAVLCPVEIRYRIAGGDHLPADRVPRTLIDIAAVQDLVVEVHRLPAVG
jgi:hypothetical protein